MSGTPSDGGNTGQVSVAQSDQGSQTAEVIPPSGAPKQESTTPTKEKDNSTEVPNLTGLPISEAIGKLTAEGLTLGDRREVPSDSIAPGKVILQDPAPETKADKGSAVSIVCSCGSPQKDNTPPQKENTAPQRKDVAPTQQKTAPSPQQKGASPTL